MPQFSLFRLAPLEEQKTKSNDKSKIHQTQVKFAVLSYFINVSQKTLFLEQKTTPRFSRPRTHTNTHTHTRTHAHPRKHTPNQPNVHGHLINQKNTKERKQNTSLPCIPFWVRPCPPQTALNIKFNLIFKFYKKTVSVFQRNRFLF